MRGSGRVPCRLGRAIGVGGSGASSILDPGIFSRPWRPRRPRRRFPSLADVARAGRPCRPIRFPPRRQEGTTVNRFGLGRRLQRDVEDDYRRGHDGSGRSQGSDDGLRENGRLGDRAARRGGGGGAARPIASALDTDPRCVLTSSSFEVDVHARDTRLEVGVDQDDVMRRRRAPNEGDETAAHLSASAGRRLFLGQHVLLQVCLPETFTGPVGQRRDCVGLQSQMGCGARAASARRHPVARARSASVSAVT